MDQTTGISLVVQSLTNTLSVNNLWGTVNEIVPVLGISVLFGLGFYLVKRVLNKIKRAKGGI